MADLGAAFGFYPQLNRRRQGSPADSANLPIDVLRGRLAGLLGAPADIANLLRSPSSTEMFGDVSYEAPAQFPYTTEKFLKDLPLAPTSRVGQVAGQAASFVPLNPMPAVRGVQKVGQVVGEELAATMLGQRPNSMMSKVVPQPLFAVAPEGLLATKTEPIESLLQTKPQAPVSDIGFYSAAEQAALNLGRNKGTGQSFINDLMKAPDVKKEELQFTGLEDFLRDKPNVTKQEVQDFLANNRVDVKEVTYGNQDFSKLPDTQLQNEYVRVRGYKPVDNYGDAMSREEIISELSGAQANDLTKYSKYQLAGGENYREILLTLPAASDDALKAHRAAKSEALVNREKAHNLLNTQGYTPTAKDYEAYNLADAEWNRIQRIPAPTQSNYLSSHFDEPNILAHMRVNDRVDADGKKMLLVEEIQSDWHQAGREKGYNDPKAQNQAQQQIDALKEEHKRLGKLKEQAKTEEEKSAISQQRFDLMNQAQELSKIGQTGIPDAPFKDTWYQLALKRLTKYAAENGYERIGLTTGRQQASRFDLSKQVDEIAVPMVNEDGSRSVRIDPTSGTSIKLMVDDKGIVTGYGAGSTQFSGKKLSEVIGKDIADKVMKADADTKFTGLDLSVGGEGMKKYYDEIYPKFLDKYGKKYGASVGETQITTDYARDASGIPAQRPSKETIRYLDITPQMKKGTSKGQPLFAATPLLPATSLLDEEKRKEITSLLE
jgi:hypothetical protein